MLSLISAGLHHQVASSSSVKKISVTFSCITNTDKALLEGYQLVVEHVAPDDLNSDRHSCGLVQETVSENVAPVKLYLVSIGNVHVYLIQDAEVFRLRAIDDTFTSLPIYTCMYRAWVSCDDSNAIIIMCEAYYNISTYSWCHYQEAMFPIL